MAQIISYYKGTVSGGATVYCYDAPSRTSPARRVYAGSGVRLPADYFNRVSGDMYPTDSPSGWMYYYNVSNILPSYNTITDPCTPPQSVTLSGKTLLITGGAGGDLNDFAGWGVSWRDRTAQAGEWGEWCEEVLTAEAAFDVEAEPAHVRQFRVRTLGSAGEEYFSDYVLCDTLLNGNEAAGTPTIALPATGAVARCHTPAIKVICTPDPDGDDVKLMRSIDGGEWEQVTAMPEGTCFDRLPYLEGGWHTVSYKAMDVNGASSGVDSVRFCVDTPGWTREISRGSVIASPTISHRADIEEMLEAVNALRIFYGMEPVKLPGEIGRFADWRLQMITLGDALDELRTATAQPLPTWPAIDSYPSAAVIRFIREAVEE